MNVQITNYHDYVALSWHWDAQKQAWEVINHLDEDQRRELMFRSLGGDELARDLTTYLYSTNDQVHVVCDELRPARPAEGDADVFRYDLRPTSDGNDHRGGQPETGA